MKEQLKLVPVKPLTPRPQSFENLIEPLLSDQAGEYAYKAAMGTSLTFDTTLDGKTVYVLRGRGMDILHQQRNHKTLISLYEEQLNFWLERLVRNEIVRLEAGTFKTKDPTYIEHSKDFYKAVFMDGIPTPVLLHRFLIPEQIATHNHVEHDTVLTLNS